MSVHDELTGLTSAYMLGALDADDLRAYEDHLKTCVDCARYLATMRAVGQVLAMDVDLVEPPASLKGRVLAAVAGQPTESRQTPPPVQAKQAPPPFEGWLPTRRWALLATAASAIIVAMLGVVLTLIVTTQSDVSDVRDANTALSAKLDEQAATLAASGNELGSLRQLDESLAAKLDDQSASLAASGADLAELRDENRALGPTLEEQGSALAAAQGVLQELRQDNTALAATLEENRADLAAAQADLAQLRSENRDIAGRLDAQDTVLGTSQGDLLSLRGETDALNAKIDTQRIFTYLQSLPTIHKFVLKATTDAPGTFGIIVTNVASSWGVAVLLGMDPLDPGTAYQIWLETDGQATDAGRVTIIDPVTGYGELYVTEFPEPVLGVGRVFVTLEPATGSPAPTGPPLLVAVVQQ